MNGDSLEREWCDTITRYFPTYEAIWQRHVAPLTFRIRTGQHWSRFIRPGIRPVLAQLADAHYATFYHLALAHTWLQKLSVRLGDADPNRRSFPTPTECFYCYFAHALSAHDAALHFAISTNKVLRRYGRTKTFGICGRKIHKNGPWEPARFRSLLGRLDLEDFNNLISRLKHIRNQLMHKHPTYLQNNGMPIDMSDNGAYSGLRAIGMLARAPREFSRSFHPVEPRLASMLRDLEVGLDSIWCVALKELDSITDPTYRQHQAELHDSDARLTADDFMKVRTLMFPAGR